MYGSRFPTLGTFSLPRLTASGGTPFFAVIPPFLGPDGNAKQYFPIDPIGGKLFRGRGRTHIDQLIYTTTTADHLISFLRPLNFTIASAAVAANGTVINLVDDPGIYSTNYRYGSTPLAAADNGIATNDYISVQCSDGSFITRKVTVATLAMTVAAIGTNVTIDKGALVYFHGIAGDIDPANGQAQPSTNMTQGALTTVASAGTGATVTFTVSTGALNAITTTPAAGGSGYPVSSTIVLNVTGGSGSGGQVLATTNSSGVVTAFAATAVAAGSGYSNTTGAATAPAFNQQLTLGRTIPENNPSGYGLISALHDGDPIIFYSPNTSAVGYLESLSGFYADR